MPLQGKSWADPNGASGSPELVAQIYFAFDSARLDQNDRRVLSSLAAHFESDLSKSRAEFSFIGNADHRGDFQYNLKLGRRRGAAVKDFLDELLGHHKNYSSWKATSLGETLASRFSPTPQRLAKDRRVDVYCSLTGKKIFILPPIIIIPPIPTVKRIVGLSRTTIKATHFRGDPRDEIGKEIVDAWMDILLPDLPWDHRTVKEIPAHYRVNRVTITDTVDYRVVHSGEVETTTNAVTYEWGPPATEVRVIKRYHAFYLGKELTDTSKEKTVPRAKADSDPNLFPPDP